MLQGASQHVRNNCAPEAGRSLLPPLVRALWASRATHMHQQQSPVIQRVPMIYWARPVQSFSRRNWEMRRRQRRSRGGASRGGGGDRLNPFTLTNTNSTCSKESRCAAARILERPHLQKGKEASNFTCIHRQIFLLLSTSAHVRPS